MIRETSEASYLTARIREERELLPHFSLLEEVLSIEKFLMLLLCYLSSQMVFEGTWILA